MTTIAMYSHDSVGLGHARRNRAVAYALARHLPVLTGQSVRGLLIAGSIEAAATDLPDGWDWMVLPGITHGPGRYVPRDLAAAPDQLHALRASTLDAALSAWDPDLLIVDRHPLGADRELEPALRRLRSRGCRTVLGLRDVLDDPRAMAAEWDELGGGRALAELLDDVWIHGDPAVHDLRITGELPDELARLSRFTGYLSLERPSPASEDGRAADGARASGEADEPSRPFVLATLGGGSDGEALARTALRAPLPIGHDLLVITGPQMPQSRFAALREEAGPHAIVRRTASDVPALIERAAAAVCMGGYNTACEVLATSTPAVMVPRVRRRTEQLRRAQSFAARGLVDVIGADELTPERLGAQLAAAVGRPIDRSSVARDGMRRVAAAAARVLDATAAQTPQLTPGPEVPDHA